MERVFVFDAYGTLFDPHSVQSRVAVACPGHGAVVTQLWRLKQLEYSWLRTLMGEPFVDFRTVTRQALQFALRSAGCLLSEAEIDDIAAEYHRLQPYPETREAVASLGARCAILSNGSQAMLDALIENSGFAGVFEQVISVDAARAFKPDPRCYALVESRLRVARENVVFVSSNGFDIAGAKRFGFTTVWVNRATPEAAPADPSQLYRLMRAQPEMLDAPPDHIARSIDFPPELRRRLM